MLHFEVDFEKCRLSKEIKCRACVDSCQMNILGIKANRVTMNPDLLQKDCVFCCVCQGACLEDLSVIKIWDDENPSLTPVPSIFEPAETVKKITEQWRR